MKDLDVALRAIKRSSGPVRVMKFSRTTLLENCQRSLWAYLGIDDADVYGEGDSRHMRIGDLPHEVWCCFLGRSMAYGKSLPEAVVSAVRGVNR